MSAPAKGIAAGGRASRQTLGQQRAAHAWGMVEAFGREARQLDDRKAFGREAKRLPIRILTAGLGHALLFLKAKQTGKPGGHVLEAVCSWLARPDGVAAAPAGAPEAIGHVMAWLREVSAAELRMATDEALSYLEWLSRFAEAEFGAAGVNETAAEGNGGS